MNLIKQIDGVINPDEVSEDQMIFDMFFDFITSLDPEQLTEEQEESLMKMFDYLDPESDEDENVDEIRYLHRVSRAAKRKAKLYRRRHKAQIRQWRRRKKVALRRSRITGRGLSGTRLGRTKRRPAPRT